jgi:hypothetical protein
MGQAIESGGGEDVVAEDGVRLADDLVPRNPVGRFTKFGSLSPIRQLDGRNIL